MGEFDCYCALCSGPLVPVEIGSSRRRHLNRRRRRVSKKLAAIEAGRSFDSFVTDSEHESDEEGDGEEGEQVDGDEEEVVYDQDEVRSYDPEIATKERVEWVEDVRVLGVHKDGDGDGRAFISGPANYDDAGMIYVQKGDDPNQPSINEKPFFDWQVCYASSNGNDVVFPFHTHCMTVLEEAFQWGFNHSGSNKESLNLNTLYKTALRIGGLGNLQIDYGGIRGVDQCWESIPGEEFSAIDPLYFPLTNLDFNINTTATTSKKDTLPLRTRAVTDPFQSLPIEIIHLICHNLPAEALQAFLIASVTAYYATLDKGFWKGLCLGRVPWAWEVCRDIMNISSVSSLFSGESEVEKEEKREEELVMDYKKLYLRLELNTAKRIGLGAESGAWMGLVNRRRIWDCCVKILGEYEKDV